MINLSNKQFFACVILTGFVSGGTVLACQAFLANDANAKQGEDSYKNLNGPLPRYPLLPLPASDVKPPVVFLTAQVETTDPAKAINLMTKALKPKTGQKYSVEITVSASE